MHGLNLRVSLEARLTKLAPNTALLHATKRHAEITIVAGVDPDHTSLNIRRHTVGTLNVLGEDGRAQAVGGIVGPANGLVFLDEGRNHHERAEHLLAVDAHVVLDVGEDGGFDEEALAVADVLVRNAASGEGGAFGLAGFDVRQDAVVLGLCDLGSLEGVVGEGVADFAGGGDDFLEESDELIVDGVVDEDSGGGRADLALVIHDADVGPFGGLFEVGVAEDDERGLSAGFESDVLHGAGGHLHDFLAGGGGAGESDLVDARVGDEGGTSNAADAVKDVNNARREAGFLEEGGHIEDAEGGLFGGFKDDGVTACEGGAKLPGGHGEGEVPGDDLANNADGLAESVGEFLVGGADCLAVDLVSPAGVVAEGVDDLAEVVGDGDGVGFAWTVEYMFMEGKLG